MVDDIIREADSKMKKALEVLRKELATLRTGRASPALVDHLHVDYYGSSLPINQLATIAVPEPRTLLIQPWDKGALGAIEKAILKSDLGLNPINDGQVIRLNIPPLTEERRRELVKVVKSHVEHAKVSIRNVRRDAIADLKELKESKQISEDDEKRAEEKVQKLTDEHIKQAEALGQAKEEEIMRV